MLYFSRIYAVDKDSNPLFNTVTYNITGGNGSTYIDIDSRTGDLWLVKELDYEEEKLLMLTVCVYVILDIAMIYMYNACHSSYRDHRTK